jgi:hypothetical protein
MDQTLAAVAGSLACEFEEPPVTGEDSLDVSLHDNELADEVELTVGLIVAINESERPLTVEEVDEFLGVGRLGLAVPGQGMSPDGVTKSYP